ncbi:MAG: 6-phospho-3-hexuloisomerase [Bacteroidota bacterium]
MVHELAYKITSEISLSLNAVEENKIAELVQSILKANRIVVCGAGRVGLACKGFAMRLGHLGKTAFAPGDSTIPRIGEGDLLILGSSSGETQTVYDVAVLAKKNGAHVVLITANQDSRMGEIAHSIIFLKTPTKFGPMDGNHSVQPMATLFEQCLQILFDIVVLLLMKDTRQTHDDLWARHSNVD